MKRAARLGGPSGFLTYGLSIASSPRLGAVDVLSLEPFRTPFYLELHLGALLQGPVAGHLDRREVNKHILAAGPLDKSIALGGVKPFDDTLFSHYLISPLSLPAVPGPCLKTLPLSHVIRSVAIGYLNRQGTPRLSGPAITFQPQTDDKWVMLKVLCEKRLAGWVMLVGTVALTGCGGGGFDARSTLESRPARLDGEQILLDQTQLDCGAREDLWIVSPLGDARSVGR